MNRNFHRVAEIADGAIQFKVIYTAIMEKSGIRVKNLSVASTVDYGFPNLFYFDDKAVAFYTLKARQIEDSLVIERDYMSNTYISELVKQKIIDEIMNFR